MMLYDMEEVPSIFMARKRIAILRTGYFKRNSWLDVSADVKIQYFFKKIFNSHVCVSVDNGTVKIQREI